MTDDLLTPHDLARICSVPVETVYYWNKYRTGPAPITVGRHVRYDPADVQQWITALKKRSAER